MLLIMTSFGMIHAQTMRWVSIPTAPPSGTADMSDKTKGQMCFGLEYTPKVSGTLTSYTTGFLVSCTSLGSPVSKNKSSSMVSNAEVKNACEEVNQVLMQCSGNSGTDEMNKVKADQPVILHKICLLIPGGESVSILEDDITNLTTSINGDDGKFHTEEPFFVTQTISRAIPDATKPTEAGSPDHTSGADADDTVMQMIFSPNPARDFLTIDVAEITEEWNWSLSDQQGRTITQGVESSGSGQTRIPLHAVDPGYYTLRVTSGKQVIAENLTIIR